MDQYHAPADPSAPEPDSFSAGDLVLCAEMSIAAGLLRHQSVFDSDWIIGVLERAHRRIQDDLPIVLRHQGE